MKQTRLKQFSTVVMTGCIVLACAGCGTSGETQPADAESVQETTSAENSGETQPTDTANEQVTTPAETSAQEGRVEPVQSMYDSNDLTNSEFAASFTVEDVEKQENQINIHLTAYDYEQFNASEIENLKAGDILVIDGQEMKVEAVEPLSDSWIQVNGGLEQDGCDLCKGENGLYYEIQLESMSYHPMTELTLPLSENFSFMDSSDPEKQEQKYTTEQFFDLLKDDIYGFHPNNTAVTVVNGEISRITRYFMP